MSYSNTSRNMSHTSGLVKGQYPTAGAGLYGSTGSRVQQQVYSSTGVRGNLYSTMELPGNYHTSTSDGVGGVDYGMGAAPMQSARSEMGWTVSRP